MKSLIKRVRPQIKRIATVLNTSAEVQSADDCGAARRFFFFFIRQFIRSRHLIPITYTLYDPLLSCATNKRFATWDFTSKRLKGSRYKCQNYGAIDPKSTENFVKNVKMNLKIATCWKNSRNRNFIRIGLKKLSRIFDTAESHCNARY